MTPVDFLLGVVGLGVVLLPGWLLARGLGQPQPLVAGFVASASSLFAVVLGLNAAGIPLSRGSLALSWLVLTAAAGVVAWRGARPVPSAAPGGESWRSHWPLLLPLLPIGAVAAYRACAQPLFGVDTIFRWNYLAVQMLARGTLDFYPPVSGADYEIYSWPDGIAPVIASLYLAVYALAGAARAPLTAPLVLFQLALLVWAVHALARRYFSGRAAAFAGALLAVSPLVAWSTIMGQETGVIAIAVTAMLLYLPRVPEEGRPAAVIFAGLAAGLASLTREYALVFPVVGLALCAARRLPWNATLLFGVSAGALALPWYLRTWLRTGNPLFNLSVGDWFPVNAVHGWLQESFQREYGWAHLPPHAVSSLVVNGGVLLLAGGVGAVLAAGRARALVAVAAVGVGLWIASVSHTAAGFTYSLRVLNPALALAAVLGGAAAARWLPGRRHLAGVTAALTLLAADAALRLLTLPANVYALPPALWLRIGSGIHHYHERPIYAEIARVAGDRRILVLGPNALLTTRGARTVPLWSPEVGFLFDPQLPAGEVARRLLAANVGFALINTGAVNERFLARSPFFREPAGALQRVWSDADMILLAVVAPPRE